MLSLAVPGSWSQMEALLIAATEAALNRHGGRFGGKAVRFLLVRDGRLGKTEGEMIREICRRLDN